MRQCFFNEIKNYFESLSVADTIYFSVWLQNCVFFYNFQVSFHLFPKYEAIQEAMQVFISLSQRQNYSDKNAGLKANTWTSGVFYKQNLKYFFSFT